MTGGRTANDHSGSRSLASVPCNGSDCGAGRRALDPTVGVLLLQTLIGYCPIPHGTLHDVCVAFAYVIANAALRARQPMGASFRKPVSLPKTPYRS